VLRTSTYLLGVLTDAAVLLFPSGNSLRSVVLMYSSHLIYRPARYVALLADDRRLLQLRLSSGLWR
jgi:hypothetical protein